ncbi:hypothetical protein RRG08_032355 [Elysia crispata]|uniref:Transmembrane protein 26 n=1 Tax=Elysia crispata TaxID=231223 RepID=A0AAE1AGY6_9GAST|nr:hypothetical protein RRG08_032355 [Elysia crispata]
MSISDNMKSSTMAADLCQVFSVFFAILVRVILAVFSILTVMVVVRERNDQRFWALTSILSLLLIEGVYTVVKRRGQERKWVCLCFACYFLASVPSVWLLELQKIGKFKSNLANTNTTSALSNLPGLSTNFELESNDIIFILENLLVFLPILCRWILPRGQITRDQLSQLLFVFIGMASDVMELFQLFEEEKVKQDSYMPYVILTVWTLSLFQFTLVLTMSASPEKARLAKGSTAADHLDPVTDRNTKNAGLKRRKKTLRQYLTQSEIWSLVISILMQDGPYLGVRLYAVIELGVINSTIFFFVLKNIIVVLLLGYRLVVVGLLVKEGDALSADRDDQQAADGAVVTPDFTGHSGSYDVNKVTPEDLDPGEAPPSPKPVESDSDRMRIRSVTSISGVSEPESQTPKPPISGKRRFGSPKVAPSDDKPDIV